MKNEIQEIIAEALYVDSSEVHSQTNLVRDLGAESIDFLDIIFRLEKRFAIKIPRGSIERQAQGHLSSEVFAPDGKLSTLGRTQLQKAMPEVAPEEIKEGMTIRQIPNLYRVSTFERLVRQHLDRRNVENTNLNDELIRPQGY